MTAGPAFSPDTLAEQLSKFEKIAGRPSRFVIAFSGGLDSTVLAHALSRLRPAVQEFTNVPIAAIHINHNLQPEASSWSEGCAATAAAFGLEFQSHTVVVQLESGKGPEASARDARYTALHGAMGAGDWLLSAHHREDQAETLLLNLIRGSGPAGVAGIGDIRRFGSGWLARPMLNVNRADILSYAEAEALTWVEDSSNTDRRFDRNFLRHEVLPRLKSRWPDIAARLQRSAGHAGEASQLLIELAAIDLAALGSRSARLPIDGLAELSEARQRNVIRFALRDQGLSTPTALQLQRIMTEIIPAREDGQPLVSWPGASVRRYRNKLYLLPETLGDSIASAPLAPGETELGPGLGRLQLLSGEEPGLPQELLEAGLRVEARIGGEEIKPKGQQHTRKLKKLLQEDGIVPWMRDRLPLIYAGDDLVAVGDLWLADDAVTTPGVSVRWLDRPRLH